MDLTSYFHWSTSKTAIIKSSTLLSGSAYSHFFGCSVQERDVVYLEERRESGGDALGWVWGQIRGDYSCYRSSYPAANITPLWYGLIVLFNSEVIPVSPWANPRSRMHNPVCTTKHAAYGLAFMNTKIILVECYFYFSLKPVWFNGLLWKEANCATGSSNTKTSETLM